jgi:methionyl aminopeptidase
MDNVAAMSIETEEELEGLRRAGQVVAVVLRELRRRVQPGVATGELDALAGRVFARHGARSAPKLVYDAPCEVFISVNDEAVHGVPGRRRLRRGDLVKLDVTAELDGFYADACVTVPVGPIAPRAARLVRAADAALARGMKAAVAGAPVRAISQAVADEAARRGVSPLAELGGHGIGRTIHEEPSVPNTPGDDPALLHAGLVITIEPILGAGGPGIRVGGPGNGWTISTADGAPAAHVEHTIVVTEDRPLVLTR